MKRAGFAAELHEELNRLPERYRVPIVLCHLEGLSNEQAAGQLGLPVRTVQRRLAQGRQRLRGRLVRRGVDPALGLSGTGFANHAASEAWLEATVRAASGVAAGQEIAVVASTAVAALTQGVLTMMFVGRLKIAAVGVMTAAAGVLVLAGAGGWRSRPGGQAHKLRRRLASRMRRTCRRQSIGPWIKGVVVDGAGKPIVGARVSSLWTPEARFVTTKADGTFVIASNETRLSNLSFLATADGGAYQGIFRFDDMITGPKDARTLVRIVLKPARTVTVSVVDVHGAPVEGAAVCVLDLVFPVAEGRTDSRDGGAARAG